MTEAQRRANIKYARESTMSYSIKLCISTDVDLINMLDAQDNKQGFIKSVLYQYMQHITRKEL